MHDLKACKRIADAAHNLVSHLCMSTIHKMMQTSFTPWPKHGPDKFHTLANDCPLSPRCEKLLASPAWSTSPNAAGVNCRWTPCLLPHNWGYMSGGNSSGASVVQQQLPLPQQQSTNTL